VARVAGIGNRSADLDALIISDYGKGFVTQELVDEHSPVARAAGLVVMVDPNPNNLLAWRGITSVKPNRSEAFREVGISGWISGKDRGEDEVLLYVGAQLLGRWDTKIVQLTLGERGMILFEKGSRPHHIPAVARGVFDVSGAGDTAIVLFTLALTAGASPVEAAEISNHASGVVVGKLGTAVLSPDELLESMRPRLELRRASDRHEAR
jgi:D-beta-D-heptose 7-phosphate kinase/D-beta-D-heptose 1-phosphate adenosyltransferase